MYVYTASSNLSFIFLITDFFIQYVICSKKPRRKAAPRMCTLCWSHCFIDFFCVNFLSSFVSFLRFMTHPPHYLTKYFYSLRLDFFSRTSLWLGRPVSRSVGWSVIISSFTVHAPIGALVVNGSNWIWNESIIGIRVHRDPWIINQCKVKQWHLRVVEIATD